MHVSLLVLPTNCYIRLGKELSTMEVLKSDGALVEASGSHESTARMKTHHAAGLPQGGMTAP